MIFFCCPLLFFRLFTLSNAMVQYIMRKYVPFYNFLFIIYALFHGIIPIILPFSHRCCCLYQYFEILFFLTSQTTCINILSFSHVSSYSLLYFVYKVDVLLWNIDFDVQVYIVTLVDGLHILCP